MIHNNIFKNISKYRVLQFTLLFLTAFVLLLSLYLEYVVGMQPCPLCLMQRLCVLLLLVFCFSSFFVVSRFKLWIVNILQIIFAGGGLFFASRQIWLQLFPSAHEAMCMPAMSLLMKYFSWNNVLKVLFWGGSDCATGVGYFLGLSMPMWSALFFIFMLLLCGFLCWLLISREAQNN